MLEHFCLALTRAVCLPDILQVVAVYLRHQDLLSCVEVCRLWTYVFTPWLWRTVDDNRYAWPRILKGISSSLSGGLSQKGYSTDKDEGWLRDTYRNHGRHIRHLRINWASTLLSVGAAGTCTRLRSLSIGEIDMLYPFEEEESLSSSVLGLGGDPALAQGAQWTAVSEYELSPIFEGALKPYPFRYMQRARRCWVSTQRFWLLVLENPHLEPLELGLCLLKMSPAFPKELLFKVLASLTQLTHLGNHFMVLDLQVILEQLPSTLQHYSSTVHSLRRTDRTFQEVELTQSFPTLRTLSLKGPRLIRAASVLNLLRYLPGLEQLTVGRLQPGSISSSEARELIGTQQHTRLRGFHNVCKDQDATRALDETIAWAILPFVPLLTEITLRVYLPEMATVLVQGCPYLETFRLLDDTSKVGIHLPPLSSNDVSSALLLQGCPKLKHLFAVRQPIYARQLLERPVVCLGLETFCCPVVGLARLTDEEKVCYQFWKEIKAMTAMTSMDGFKDEEAEKVEKRAKKIEGKIDTCQVQHTRIYDLFVGLTELTTLDIGVNHFAGIRSNDIPGLKKNTFLLGGRFYFTQFVPIRSSLRLSLGLGLDRLKTLKKLRVFGFKGHDHRVEADALTWMVENWPRPTTVFGLDDYRVMERFALDCPKTRMLTRHVQALRPDIILSKE